MEIVETKVYTYDKLSDEAKQVALEKLRNINVNHDWWDFVYKDVNAVAALMGININQIYFSGFWSKGDGACFEGLYEYKAGSVKAVEAYAPKDEELHRIAAELAALQRKCFYQIRASFQHSGDYYHRFCTDFSVDFKSHVTGSDYYNEETEGAIIKAIRDLMHWTYWQLKSNYDALTTDEAVAETIKDNDYNFTNDGKIFNFFHLRFLDSVVYFR